VLDDGDGDHPVNHTDPVVLPCPFLNYCNDGDDYDGDDGHHD